MAPASTNKVAAEETKPLVQEDEAAPTSKPSLRKSRTKGNFERAKDYVNYLKELPDDSPIKQGIRCFCKYGLKPLICIFMFYVWLFKKLYCIYQYLPHNCLQMIFGVTLCFFGGSYWASLAAAEAAINLGGQELWVNLRTVWEQAQIVATVSAEDDKVDADHNNIPDVEEMSLNDLMSHKAKVAAMAVTEPERLEGALMSLLNVWIAVLAILKMQFAKTVALCLGITNMLSLPLARIFGPFLAAVMGPDLNHWVPTIIDTILKIIALCVAAFVQSFISAFYSGLRGGRLFAEGLINVATQYGIMDKFPDCLATKPFDPDKSYLDEFIAYPLFAVGFWWQVTHGFALEFPFNILLLPLSIIEWFIRIEIFFG